MLTPVLRRGLRRARLSAGRRLQRSGVRLACETTAQHARAVPHCNNASNAYFVLTQSATEIFFGQHQMSPTGGWCPGGYMIRAFPG